MEIGCSILFLLGCNFIITAAKRAISRDRRNKYTPCFDARCKDLYQAFLRTPRGKTSNTTTSTLLDRFDEKRKRRWSDVSLNYYLTMVETFVCLHDL